jgi:hypothetical protein
MGLRGHLVCRLSVTHEDDIVSLPLVWMQEIKRMMVVYFAHGLFLTCTQKTVLYLQVMHHNIDEMYNNFQRESNPLHQQSNLTLLT